MLQGPHTTTSLHHFLDWTCLRSHLLLLVFLRVFRISSCKIHINGQCFIDVFFSPVVYDLSLQPPRCYITLSSTVVQTKDICGIVTFFYLLSWSQNITYKSLRTIKNDEWWPLFKLRLPEQDYIKTYIYNFFFFNRRAVHYNTSFTSMHKMWQGNSWGYI